VVIANPIVGNAIKLNPEIVTMQMGLFIYFSRVFFLVTIPTLFLALLILRINRKSNSKNLRTVLFLIAFGFSIALLFSVRSVLFSPSVTLKNASQETIYEVALTAKNFAKTVPQLRSGDSITFRICPSGESSLEIKFRNARGGFSTYNELAYLEPGDGSHVLLTITPNQSVDRTFSK